MGHIERCPIHGDQLAIGLNGRKMCPVGHFCDTTDGREDEVAALREQLRGAVDRIAELEADLKRERVARRVVDEALRDALARANSPHSSS